MVWDLDEVAAARCDHGPRATLDLLGRPSAAQSTAPVPQRPLTDGTTGVRLHWALPKS
ncbi:hypothetical protein [Streptomyces sp. NPDC005784]|uniref:hypothetical protein n=1 Tax=Streptomyces sp. NPDC005784 TaxID=3364731 RepID=UPI0036CD45BC